MSDIVFNCPSCNQTLEAPPEMAGQSLACPNCNNSLTIPRPASTGSKLRVVIPTGGLRSQVSQSRLTQPPPPAKTMISSALLVAISVMIALLGVGVWLIDLFCTSKTSAQNVSKTTLHIEPAPTEIPHIKTADEITASVMKAYAMKMSNLVRDPSSDTYKTSTTKYCYENYILYDCQICFNIKGRKIDAPSFNVLVRDNGMQHSPRFEEVTNKNLIQLVDKMQYLSKINIRSVTPMPTEILGFKFGESITDFFKREVVLGSDELCGFPEDPTSATWASVGLENVSFEERNQCYKMCVDKSRIANDIVESCDVFFLDGRVALLRIDLKFCVGNESQGQLAIKMAKVIADKLANGGVIEEKTSSSYLNHTDTFDIVASSGAKFRVTWDTGVNVYWVDYINVVADAATFRSSQKKAGESAKANKALSDI